MLFSGTFPYKMWYFQVHFYIKRAIFTSLSSIYMIFQVTYVFSTSGYSMLCNMETENDNGVKSAIWHSFSFDRSAVWIQAKFLAVFTEYVFIDTRFEPPTLKLATVPAVFRSIPQGFEAIIPSLWSGHDHFSPLQFFFCGTTDQIGPRPPHCWGL